MTRRDFIKAAAILSAAAASGSTGHSCVSIPQEKQILRFAETDAAGFGMFLERIPLPNTGCHLIISRSNYFDENDS